MKASILALVSLVLASTTTAALAQGGQIRFSNATYEVSESSPVAFVTLFRVGDDDGEISVTFIADAGTATSGADFVPIVTSVSWPDNDDDPRVVQVSIVDDDIAESSETVLLSLTNPTGGATIGSPGSATLTILDDGDTESGPGELALVSPTVVVAESEAALLVVRRTSGSAGEVSVGWSSSNGSAFAGEDYVASSGLITFADGDTTDKSIVIATLEDDLLEGDETFDVELSLPAGGASLGLAQSTVNIVDNDVVSDGPCVADETTMCLGADDRFRLSVKWRTTTTNGDGIVYGIGPESSGLFWFFNENNIEMLVKVLDACGLPDFNSFWVFYAATTDVAFDLVVTDTVAERSKVYSNPLGQTAAPVTDTAAFATCDP